MERLQKLFTLLLSCVFELGIILVVWSCLEPEPVKVGELVPMQANCEPTSLVSTTVTTTSITTTTTTQPCIVDDTELYLLAHLIYAEAGSDWCTDEMQIGVGSVALNRVEHHLFPDTLYDVIYQSGQYSCTWNGSFDYTPNQRAWNTAQYLLENGSQFPNNVVFQAGFVQGSGIYKQVQNMYFCYTDK